MKIILTGCLSISLILGAASAFANANHKDVRIRSQSNVPANDNTAVNQRDRSVNELTADQQGMNSSDADTTRLIRQELMRDNSLSTYAHNIKVIAKDGKITLKGPVKSADERRKVVAIAKKFAGNYAVEENIDLLSE